MTYTNRLALTVSVAALLLAGAAHAQDAQTEAQTSATDADVATTVIVRGSYAGSLKKAMAVKRDSAVVVESLSLSDLGQLPDVSVADALARLPGLAADRDPNNGAASQIALRGLPAEMMLGTMNGRDLASSTPDRNIRYDQFPTELIGGALVYKSPMASIPEGGVAGSIDLKTIHPLDVKENKWFVSATEVFAPFSGKFAQGKDSGYRTSLSYMGRTQDKKFGIAFGIAVRDEPFAAQRTQHASLNPTTYMDLGGDSQQDLVTYGLTNFVRVGTDKRDGAFLTLEFKPNDKLHVVVDGLYSKVKIFDDIHGFYIDNTSALWANSYTNSVVDGNTLVAGTITNTTPGYGVRISNQNAFARRNDTFDSIGINAQYKLDSQSWLDMDLAKSHVDYLADYAFIDTDVQSGPAQSVTFDSRPKVTSIGVNVDLTNPTINMLTQMQVPFYEDGTDDSTNARVDFHHSFNSDGFAKGVVFGVRTTDRHKTNIKRDGTINITPTVIDPSLVLPFARGSYTSPQDGGPEYMTFNFFDVANRYFGGYHPTDTSVSAKTGTWDVHEKTTALYGQLDFESSLFGIDYTGNIGLRVVKTEDNSSSFRLIDPGNGNTTLEPYSVSNDYTDTLPSLNLKFQPSHDWIIRVGLAQTIARPAIDDLNAGFSAYDYGTPQAYGGNPLLEPFRADQLDLTNEWYFGSNDFIAVSAYYKHLRSFITTSTDYIDINGTPYQFFQPVNGHGGYIQGIEFTYQQQFDQLPAPWDGLGVYANVAFADSDVKVTRNFSAATLGLNNMSKNVGTATLYYYKNGFELRGSYRYRSSFSRVVDGGGFENNEAEGFLDFQTSYAFKNGVSVVIQGSNLLNAPYKTNLGSPNLRGRYEEFGTYYYAGIRAKF